VISQTKPMIQNLNDQSPKSRLVIFATVLGVVFVISVICSVVISLILPETYVSKARVLVETSTGSVDPNLVKAEFDAILSNAVLERAIEKLNLNVVWGRKYLNGENLSTAETLKMLKARLTFLPIDDTSIIEIIAYSEDSHEAALIANAVAETYQHVCSEKRAAERARNHFDPSIIDDPPVSFIQVAEPASQPCGPNIPLNIFRGVVAGIFLGSIVATTVVFALRGRELKAAKL
jgi:capsular polysaccharide biosynthesis protein